MSTKTGFAASDRHMTDRVRILIVDDHKLFAEALSMTLEEEGMAVLGVATTGRDALEAARKHRPDLVLMDLGLPDLGGVSVGRQIMDESQDAKVVALTGRDDTDSVSEVTRAGFHGYLTKDTSIAQVVNSIRATMGGQTVLPYRLVGKLNKVRSREEQEATMLTDQLTPRERQVLALLVEGSTGDEMARRLSVSQHTIRTHIQNILTKLGVHSRLKAVAFAVRYRLVTLPNGSAEGIPNA